MHCTLRFSTLSLLAALAGFVSTMPLTGCDKKPEATEAADEDDDEPKKKKKKKSDDSDDDEPKASKKRGDKQAASSAAVDASAAPSAEPASEESFFGGAIPSGVKQKPIKAKALEGGALLFQPLEGYSGGSMGTDYMSMRPDQSVVFRVITSHAVVPRDQGMTCADLAGHVKMAPERASNVQKASPGVLRKVGVNGFVAREGSCTGDGPKGALAIHYIDLRVESGADDAWHYAAIVSFPKDATAELRNEAMAWARSVEFNGRNGYKL